MDQRKPTQPLPAPGIGASYEGRDPVLLDRILPLVDYVEVTLESIAEIRSDEVRLCDEVMAEIRSIGKDAKIIVHGVGLSIGSHNGWSPTYCRLLDRFLERIDVAWHSEHLGYTQVDGDNLGIMLAMPRTEEALDLICKRVELIQERYQLPFLLENIVHVIPDCTGEYSDAAFLNAITHRTGCGLLVDAYNLECDAHNHSFDIHSFLSELDHGSVREVHVARGVEHNGFLLDVHSEVTHPSTIAIAQDVIAGSKCRVEAVIYEFLPEAIPNLGHDAIVNELKGLKRSIGVP